MALHRHFIGLAWWRGNSGSHNLLH